MHNCVCERWILYDLLHKLQRLRWPPSVPGKNIWRICSQKRRGWGNFRNLPPPPPHKKNRLQGLCEKSQRIHFENYIYLAYFFAVHFPSFRLGRKTNAARKDSRRSSFLFSFCSRVSFCCVLCAKSFSKRQQELRILKWFRVPSLPSPGPLRLCRTLHVARRNILITAAAAVFLLFTIVLHLVGKQCATTSSTAGQGRGGNNIPKINI